MSLYRSTASSSRLQDVHLGYIIRKVKLANCLHLVIRCTLVLVGPIRQGIDLVIEVWVAGALRNLGVALEGAERDEEEKRVCPVVELDVRIETLVLADPQVVQDAVSAEVTVDNVRVVDETHFVFAAYASARRR
jgi:hypothetical protein